MSIGERLVEQENRKRGDPAGTAGLAVALSSLPFFVLGLLCMLRVMLRPLLGVVFGELAGCLAACGIVLSGVGVHRAACAGGAGLGRSIDGLVTGAVMLALTLAAAVVWICVCDSGSPLLPALA